MQSLKEFLNDSQQNSISDYKYIPDTKIHDHKMKKGDYIKFMLKPNYQFNEGGIIINIDRYPIVILKSYQQPTSQNYSLDLTQIYEFITTGAGSGVLSASSIELTPKQCATALIEQGSDPEFFGINEDGEEIDKFGINGDLDES